MRMRVMRFLRSPAQISAGWRGECRRQAALRALAFKWIRILHRGWTDRTPYDEARYLLALQKRQAPLLKFAVESPT